MVGGRPLGVGMVTCTCYELEPMMVRQGEHQHMAEAHSLSRKSSNVYDPRRHQQGLMLDGQTLVLTDTLLNNEDTDDVALLKLLGRCTTLLVSRDAMYPRQ